MIRLVLLGTHEYQWAFGPFAKLFKKYWSHQTVTYVGDKLVGDLPKNICFMQVPAYSEGVWNWEYWFGNGLISLLKEITEPIVAIFLPDHWITQSVDTRKVKKLAEYMLEMGNVVRGNLTAGTPLENHGQQIGKWKGLDIISVAPNDIHASLDGGITFCPSLWNVELLLRILEPHWGLWQCEKVGTEKMIREFPGWISVGTRPALLHRAHGLKHKSPKQASLTGLNEEDRQIVLSHLPEGWSVAE